MPSLPPINWTEVATKGDLIGFEHRLDAKDERSITRAGQSSTRVAVLTMLGGQVTLAGILVGAFQVL